MWHRSWPRRPYLCRLRKWKRRSVVASCNAAPGASRTWATKGAAGSHRKTTFSCVLAPFEGSARRRIAVTFSAGRAGANSMALRSSRPARTPTGTVTTACGAESTRPEASRTETPEPPPWSTDVTGSPVTTSRSVARASTRARKPGPSSSLSSPSASAATSTSGPLAPSSWTCSSFHRTTLPTSSRSRGFECGQCGSRKTASHRSWPPSSAAASQAGMRLAGAT
mmetsp:Transcript_23166/g.71873  ORF Transcript_23166/g.71873 Transcript_23166/m.71873 type:complete len:224 (-) Transcript_23166:926-1597(-)